MSVNTGNIIWGQNQLQNVPLINIPLRSQILCGMFGFRGFTTPMSLLFLRLLFIIICDSSVFYPFTAPPTFSEAVFGPWNIRDAEDNQYTQGNLNYIPRYPVYSFVSK
jgi:hypothetical protein